MVRERSETDAFGPDISTKLVLKGVIHLTEMIGSFPHKRVNEVGTAERSSDNRENISSIWRSHFDVLAHVREDILVAERNESYIYSARINWANHGAH